MTNINQATYEVSVALPVHLDHAADLIKPLMIDYGVDDTDIIQRCEEDQTYLSVFFEQKQHADLLKEKLSALALSQVTLDVIKHEQDEWLNAWKRDWKPFALTPRIDVVPSWLADEYTSTKEHVIYLDTVSAFGTGLHETTQFMSELIEEYAASCTSFFDIGTGTGILCAVAKIVGAQEIWACDIDEHCIDVAKQNLDRNGMTFDWIEAHDISEFTDQKQFDFVAANLVTQDLVDHGQKIVSFVKEGGYLAVSGISRERLDWLKKEFEQFPLDDLKTVEGKKWSAVLYKKRR